MEKNKPIWNVHILTLFEEAFPGPLEYSITGRALKKNLWNFKTHNIRNYADNKHNRIDDTPFGGGAGMVMMAEPISRAIDHIKEKENIDQIIYMSPRGQKLNQKICHQVANLSNIIILCGRFEGVDQRLIDYYNMKEISIGDYVLSCGDIAAISMMDACIRLLPGTVDKNSLKEESFAVNSEFSELLEYPQYTQPANWRGINVPEILLSGNHSLIKRWRLDQAKNITNKRKNV